MIGNMVPVQSSAIKAIGYDWPKHTLLVEFKSGGFYTYKGVSHSLYRELRTAESIGRFYHNHIKGNFPYEVKEWPNI